MPVSYNPFTGQFQFSRLVTQSNNSTNSTLYIRGNDVTDGSIRLQFTDGDTNAHIERRANGVWNDTGFRFASSSIQLGRNTNISAIASFLETIDLSATAGHVKSFIPHTEVGEDGGSEFTHAPKIKRLETFNVFTGAVSQVEGTLSGGLFRLGINLGVSPSRIVEKSIHEVGTIGATKPVTVKFFKGTNNSGTLFDQKVLPTIDLSANTTLSIDYDQDLGFEGGQSIFQEFSSEDNFSLKTDSGGNPLTIHSAHELAQLGISTENVMLDLDLGVMFDTSLNPMYAIQFP